MEVKKFSRGQIILFGSSAIAAGLTPAAAFARLRRNTASVVNYPDGVGLVDQNGNSLLRLRWGNGMVSAEGGGQLWSIPVGAQPGYTYNPVPGVTIAITNNGYAQYRTNSGAGNTSAPPQKNAPLTVYDSELGGSQVVGHMPKEWPGGGKGGPHPLDIQCVLAIANFAAAALALAGALGEFLGGPIAWGPALWSLLGAAGWYSTADAAMQLACGGG